MRVSNFISGIFLFLFSLYCSIAYALPEGYQVQAGSAEFNQPNEQTLNVTTSDRVIINYNSFSIAQPEAVNFYQPASSSVALNRIVGLSPSEIFGTLTATGKIFLVNPNGILFGPTSYVDVAGLVASTLDITNEAFLSGNYVFNKYADKVGASVINQGYIQAKEAVLMGQAVKNEGQIVTTLGKTISASGEKMTLGLDTAGMISVAIDEAVKEKMTVNGEQLTDGVKNTGEIRADGGIVVLTAKALDNIFDYAVNNEGIIQAKSLVAGNGTIELVAWGENSKITNSGTLDVSSTADGVDGGSVNVSADYIDNIGKIIADAADYSQAGNISLVANKKLSLEDTSLISVAGKDIESSGGNVYLYSYGDAYAKGGQTIDISGGTISGDGGFGRFSAVKHISLDGNFIGETTSGFREAEFIIDPESSTISGDYSNVTVYSPGGITVAGNVTVAKNKYLNVFADHTSEIAGSWDNGSGAITRSGNFTITGENVNSVLRLKAGSGIGTDTVPILINVKTLSAENNTSGGIYISQGGKYAIIIGVDGVGLKTNDGNGSISLTANDNVTVAENISANGSGAVDLTTTNTTPGRITISSGKSVGSSSGTVTLTTNDLVINGTISGGNVRLQPYTTGRSIGLGDRSGDFNLTDAELDNVTTGGQLILGRSNSGLMAIGTLTQDAKNLEFISGSNILVDTITTTGNIILTASGSILDDLNNTTKITANALSLIAAAGIGASGAGQIDTSVNSLSAVANNGSIYLENDKNLTITSATASGTGNDINITVNSDLTVGSISAPDAVTLTANSGSILDGNGSLNNITVNGLILSAKNGIGSGNALETQVSNLEAYNSDSGNIEIDNTGTLTIFGNGVVNDGGGDINIITGSSLYVEAEVRAVDYGEINLTANGADGDIVVRETISSVNGDINIDADRDILTEGDITAIESTGLGNIKLNAGRDITLGTSSGYGDVYSYDGDINLIAGNDITVDYYTWVDADGVGSVSFEAGNDISLITRVIDEESRIYTNSGDIDLTAGNDILIDALSEGVTSSSGDITLLANRNVDIGYIETDGDVSITADNDSSGTGAITDNNADSDNILADDLVLSAAEGIGDGDALETDVNTLNATNTTSGNIEIDNAGDLIVGSVTTPDDVIITVSSSILDDTDETNYVSGNTVNLTASDDIGSSGLNGDIDTDANTVIANAGGDIYLEEKDGAIFDPITATGLANILAHGDSTLGTITTGGNFVFRTTAGNVTITSGTVTSNLGAVDITSDLGSIYAIGPGPHIVALLTSYLTAPYGVVGTISGYPSAGYGPVNVNIGGNLVITAGGSALPLVDGSITPWAGTFWPVSSNIIGIVSGSTTYTGANIVLIPATSGFPGALIFNPPGYVFFNTTEIWPDLPLPIGAERFHRLLVNWPVQELLALFRVLVMDLATHSGTVFFYHPVTPFDSSAFEGFQLTEDMYEFIEGRLNLKEGEFFSWFEEEFKKRKQ